MRSHSERLVQKIHLVYLFCLSRLWDHERGAAQSDPFKDPTRLSILSVSSGMERAQHVVVGGGGTGRGDASTSHSNEPKVSKKQPASNRQAIIKDKRTHTWV
jgi:hypothetical protein